VAAANSVSDFGQLWSAHAAGRYSVRCAPRCAGIAGGRLGLSSRTHAAAAPGVCALGAAPSFPLCDGRLAVAESELWRGADENDFSGQSMEEGLGGTENGRPAPAALAAGRVGEFCGVVDVQSAGGLELNGVGSNLVCLYRTG